MAVIRQSTKGKPLKRAGSKIGFGMREVRLFAKVELLVAVISQTIGSAREGKSLLMKLGNKIILLQSFRDLRFDFAGGADIQ